MKNTCTYLRIAHLTAILQNHLRPMHCDADVVYVLQLAISRQQPFLIASASMARVKARRGARRMAQRIDAFIFLPNRHRIAVVFRWNPKQTNKSFRQRWNPKKNKRNI